MLSEVLNRVILVLVLQMCIVSCNLENSTVSNNRIRRKRTLNFYFPYNSCYAFAVVMSLPLEDLPASRSAFFSYSFETNFYYPYYDQQNGIIPLPFTWIDEPGANAGTKHRIDLSPAYRQFTDDDEGKENAKNNKFIEKTKAVQENEEKEEKENVTKTLNVKEKTLPVKKNQSKKKKNKSRKVRSLLNNYFMSRRRFYKIMESKMDKSGLRGHDCLLKAICETSESRFGLNNGVIGSVVDILFLPSSSKDEQLPGRYNQAEANGKLKNCATYNKACPKGIFDFISKKI